MTPERVYLINLDRRADRLRQFHAMYQSAGMPDTWPRPIRLRAIDGTLVPMPREYYERNGTYGCMRSHTRILEDCLHEGINSVAVFEDDAVCVPEFTRQLESFVANVPSNWDCIILGCEHIAPPMPVRPNVVKVTKCARTHAYIARGRFIRELYRQWAMCPINIDWRWQEFLSAYHCYAPSEPLVAQREGRSDIENLEWPERSWSIEIPKLGDDPGIFTHSGDLGDCIFGMAAIKALGGGRLYLFDRPTKISRARMTARRAENLASLLRIQPYIYDVTYCATGLPEGVRDSRLNYFRSFACAPRNNLADAHMAAYGLWPDQSGAPWITVDRPEAIAQVVFSRTARYRGENFPWKRVYEQYGHKAIFVGTKREHRRFCDEVGYVPFTRTHNLLDVARVIYGSELFVGNQSAPHAVAEGLKHRIILEVNRGFPVLFHRMNCLNVIDQKVELPQLD